MHAPAFAHPMRAIEALEVPPGSTVVDFGAGSGHYTLLLAREVGETGNVYAIDVQEDLLKKIKKEAHGKGLTNVHVIHGDVERRNGSKLRGRSADLVVMSNVLFQLHNKRTAFEEARRILQLNGRLVVIDWEPHESRSIMRLGPPKSHRYPKEQALLEAKGEQFEYAGSFDAGSHHYGMIFIAV